MSSTLYLECASGISGDMTVAALIDLGASRIKLLNALNSLNVEGYSVAISRVNVRGLDACDFNVVLEHEHKHEHCHEHEHEHTHPHIHRNLADVTAIINSGDLTPRARETAIRIFTIVAEAESQAHGKPIDEVHFHEVGAIDSIIDIVGAAVCLDDLDITRVIVPVLNEGTGFVNCQHGLLPVPVPAVAAIAQSYRIPLNIQPDINGEMVTPTGIAIAAAIRTESGLPGTFVIEKTGLGAGKRDFGRPNILRAMLIEPQKIGDNASSDATMLLETNIDDATGEQLGLAMEILLKEGALDVHYIPAFTKKNRPAWLLRVICHARDAEKIQSVIFKHTPTIGLRRFALDRVCLQRSFQDVTLPAGTVRVKCCFTGTETLAYPEYESVRALSETTGIPFMELYQAAQKAALEQS